MDQLSLKMTLGVTGMRLGRHAPGQLLLILMKFNFLYPIAPCLVNILKHGKKIHLRMFSGMGMQQCLG